MMHAARNDIDADMVRLIANATLRVYDINGPSDAFIRYKVHMNQICYRYWTSSKLPGTVLVLLDAG